MGLATVDEGGRHDLSRRYKHGGFFIETKNSKFWTRHSLFEGWRKISEAASRRLEDFCSTDLRSLFRRGINYIKDGVEDKNLDKKLWDTEVQTKKDPRGKRLLKLNTRAEKILILVAISSSPSQCEHSAPDTESCKTQIECATKTTIDPTQSRPHAATEHEPLLQINSRSNTTTNIYIKWKPSLPPDEVAFIWRAMTRQSGVNETETRVLQLAWKGSFPHSKCNVPLISVTPSRAGLFSLGSFVMIFEVKSKS